MIIVQWALTGGLFLFFAAFALCNLLTLILRYARNRPGSLVLFAPAAAGVAAFLLCPIAEVRAYWWIPLLVDFSAPLYAIIVLVWLVGRLCRTRWRAD